MSLLEKTIQSIKPVSQDVAEKARARQDQLTKPQGSLGLLETISVQIAGITGQLNPQFNKKHVVVMAGDHGVAADGVSAFPIEVTPQMLFNMLNGGAGINVLAEHVGAEVTVVDIGVAVPIESDHPRFLSRKIAFGTQNIATGPAMSGKQAQQAIETGIDVVNRLAETKGVDLMITGELGIGNTTPSAAIASVITGLPPADVTGRGTGVDDKVL